MPTKFVVRTTVPFPAVGQSTGTFIIPAIEENMGDTEASSIVGVYELPDGYGISKTEDDEYALFDNKTNGYHFASWNGHWGKGCRVRLCNQYAEIIQGNLKKA